ncbi:hypothetical protein ABK040_003179 [Willaertia magna]
MKKSNSTLSTSSSSLSERKKNQLIVVEEKEQQQLENNRIKGLNKNIESLNNNQLNGIDEITVLDQKNKKSVKFSFFSNDNCIVKERKEESKLINLYKKRNTLQKNNSLQNSKKFKIENLLNDLENNNNIIEIKEIDFSLFNFVKNIVNEGILQNNYQKWKNKVLCDFIVVKDFELIIYILQNILLELFLDCPNKNLESLLVYKNFENYPNIERILIFFCKFLKEIENFISLKKLIEIPKQYNFTKYFTKNYLFSFITLQKLHEYQIINYFDYINSLQNDSEIYNFIDLFMEEKFTKNLNKELNNFYYELIFYFLFYDKKLNTLNFCKIFEILKFWKFNDFTKRKIYLTNYYNFLQQSEKLMEDNFVKFLNFEFFEFFKKQNFIKEINFIKNNENILNDFIFCNEFNKNYLEDEEITIFVNEIFDWFLQKLNDTKIFEILFEIITTMTDQLYLPLLISFFTNKLLPFKEMNTITLIDNLMEQSLQKCDTNLFIISLQISKNIFPLPKTLKKNVTTLQNTHLQPTDQWMKNHIFFCLQHFTNSNQNDSKISSFFCKVFEMILPYENIIYLNIYQKILQNLLNAKQDIVNNLLKNIKNKLNECGVSTDKYSLNQNLKNQNLNDKNKDEDVYNEIVTILEFYEKEQSNIFTNINISINGTPFIYYPVMKKFKFLNIFLPNLFQFKFKNNLNLEINEYKRKCLDFENLKNNLIKEMNQRGLIPKEVMDNFEEQNLLKIEVKEIGLLENLIKLEDYLFELPSLLNDFNLFLENLNFIFNLLNEISKKLKVEEKITKTIVTQLSELILQIFYECCVVTNQPNNNSQKGNNNWLFLFKIFIFIPFLEIDCNLNISEIFVTTLLNTLQKVDSTLQNEDNYKTQFKKWDIYFMLSKLLLIFSIFGNEEKFIKDFSKKDIYITLQNLIKKNSVTCCKLFFKIILHFYPQNIIYLILFCKCLFSFFENIPNFTTFENIIFVNPEKEIIYEEKENLYLFHFLFTKLDWMLQKCYFLFFLQNEKRNSQINTNLLLNNCFDISKNGIENILTLFTSQKDSFTNFLNYHYNNYYFYIYNNINDIYLTLQNNLFIKNIFLKKEEENINLENIQLPFTEFIKLELNFNYLNENTLQINYFTNYINNYLLTNDWIDLIKIITTELLQKTLQNNSLQNNTINDLFTVMKEIYNSTITVDITDYKNERLQQQEDDLFLERPSTPKKEEIKIEELSFWVIEHFLQQNETLKTKKNLEKYISFFSNNFPAIILFYNNTNLENLQKYFENFSEKILQNLIHFHPWPINVTKYILEGFLQFISKFVNEKTILNILNNLFCNDKGFIYFKLNIFRNYLSCQPILSNYKTLQKIIDNIFTIPFNYYCVIFRNEIFVTSDKKSLMIENILQKESLLMLNLFIEIIVTFTFDKNGNFVNSFQFLKEKLPQKSEFNYLPFLDNLEYNINLLQCIKESVNLQNDNSNKIINNSLVEKNLQTLQKIIKISLKQNLQNLLLEIIFTTYCNYFTNNDLLKIEENSEILTFLEKLIHFILLQNNIVTFIEIVYNKYLQIPIISQKQNIIISFFNYLIKYLKENKLKIDKTKIEEMFIYLQEIAFSNNYLSSYALLLVNQVNQYC